MENIYVYFSAFRRSARNAGWTKERIDAVLEDARSSDYEHALEVIMDATAELKEEKEPIKFYL